MHYKFTFRPQNSKDQATHENIVLDIQPSHLSEDMSRGFNLDRVLTLAYNAMIRHCVSIGEAQEEQGYSLVIQEESKDKLDDLTEVQMLRGEVAVDVFAITPVGEQIQLNDSDKPVIASWEPKLELPHLRACFPKFYQR